MTQQKQAFLTQEGDNFYQRNVKALEHDPVRPELGWYAAHLKPGMRILEIGCANGRNLEYFQRHHRVQAFGIDPSGVAIQRGEENFPDLRLAIGTADDLPYPDEFFDFVLFGFCLYLVDRPLLARVVAEADRVLKDRGLLGITDFDVPIPTRRAYKHHIGLHSYKCDYSRLFLAFPQYVIAGKTSFSHASAAFEADPQERISAVLLYKDHTNAYTFLEDGVSAHA